MFQNAISVILVSDCFVIVTCWLQVGGNTEGVAAQPDPHSYMQAYKEWRYKKTSGDTRQLGSLQDIKVCDAADTSLKPAADTSLKTAADTSLKPASDTSLKPAADTSLKPAADTSLKPAADTSFKPAADTSLKHAADTLLNPLLTPLLNPLLTLLNPLLTPFLNPLLTPLSLSGSDRVSGAGVCGGSTFQLSGSGRVIRGGDGTDDE